jgi:hypothetical protein
MCVYMNYALLEFKIKNLINFVFKKQKMSKYEYVGRAGKFLGKSLPQIRLKLKDLGVGRLFTRDTYKRYPGK